jgi:hypothetical protein
MYVDNLSIAGILVSLAVVAVLVVMFPRWRANLQEEEVRDDERD